MEDRMMDSSITIEDMVRDPERFWSKVDIREPNECWEWVAKAKTYWGYGVFSLDRKQGVIGAHRMAWMLHNDALVPSGGFVLHSCDNPGCCNPHHLSVGTPLENMQQMYQRGRARHVAHKGEKNGRALLKEDDVRAIRSSSEPYKVLAARYGISKQQVCSVKSRRAWKDVA